MELKFLIKKTKVDKGPSNIDFIEQRVDILTKALTRVKFYRHVGVIQILLSNNSYELELSKFRKMVSDLFRRIVAVLSPLDSHEMYVPRQQRKWKSIVFKVFCSKKLSLQVVLYISFICFNIFQLRK